MNGKVIIALTGLATSVLGGVTAEPVSCLEAIREQSDGVLSGEIILGVIGFSGSPRPDRWLVLSRTGEGADLLERALAGGEVVAQRKVTPLPGQGLPGIGIDLAEVRVDSDEAFRIAAEAAREQAIDFSTAHFHLRCRDGNSEPVWLLKLLGAAQNDRGLVYLSARTGEILRTAWTPRAIEDFALVSPIVTRR